MPNLHEIALWLTTGRGNASGIFKLHLEEEEESSAKNHQRIEALYFKYVFRPAYHQFISIVPDVLFPLMFNFLPKEDWPSISVVNTKWHEYMKTPAFLHEPRNLQSWKPGICPCRWRKSDPACSFAPLATGIRIFNLHKTSDLGQIVLSSVRSLFIHIRNDYRCLWESLAPAHFSEWFTNVVKLKIVTCNRDVLMNLDALNVMGNLRFFPLCSCVCVTFTCFSSLFRIKIDSSGNRCG